MKKKFNKALVIGSGAFGTSIASVLACNFEKVILLGRSSNFKNNIEQNHENKKYLPGQILEENIYASSSWDELEGIERDLDLLVFGIPSTAITSYLYDHFDDVERIVKKGVPVVSLSKGIDPVTLELSDDLFFNFFSSFKDQFTFLSGPSFAREIMDKQITLVSLAGKSREILIKISNMLETPFFKVMPNYDIKGVLLGGALKNILAIAGGVIEGLGYNDNTRAAMITRGIAEMLRFGVIFNARPETFYGLSGMGDLILTTTGELSRNKKFGLQIAKGHSVDEALKIVGHVVEGYKTTLAAYRLSEKYEIRARIFNGAHDVLFLGKRPQDVILELMNSPTRFELG